MPWRTQKIYKIQSGLWSFGDKLLLAGRNKMLNLGTVFWGAAFALAPTGWESQTSRDKGKGAVRGHNRHSWWWWQDKYMRSRFMGSPVGFQYGLWLLFFTLWCTNKTRHVSYYKINGVLLDLALTLKRQPLCKHLTKSIRKEAHKNIKELTCCSSANCF